MHSRQLFTAGNDLRLRGGQLIETGHDHIVRSKILGQSGVGRVMPRSDSNNEP